MKSLSLAMLLLAGFSHSAFAQATLKFAPQEKAGETIRIQREIDVKQTLTLAGQNIETENQSFMVSQETVRAVDDQGNRTLEGKFDAFQSTLTLPGGIKLEFDAGSPPAEAPLPQLQPVLDLFTAVSKAVWVATFSPAGAITDFKYEGEPFADIDDMFKADVQPETMIEEQNNELKRYRTEPVQKGDVWTQREEMRLGGGQMLKLKREYKYLGEATQEGRTVDRVAVKVLEVDYEAEANAPSPLVVKESDLQAVSSEGTLVYDRQAGRYQSTEEKMHIEGPLKMVLNGQELEGAVDLTIAIKMTVQ